MLFFNHLTLPHQVKNWCDALSHLNNVFHISCFHLIKQTISTLDPDTVAPRGEEWGSTEKRIWASLSWIDVIVMIQGDCCDTVTLGWVKKQNRDRDRNDNHKELLSLNKKVDILTLLTFYLFTWEKEKERDDERERALHDIGRGRM